jgi:hypothetical protein
MPPRAIGRLRLAGLNFTSDVPTWNRYTCPIAGIVFRPSTSP